LCERVDEIFVLCKFSVERWQGKTGQLDDDRAIELDWASENGECGGLVLLSSSPRRLATAVMKGEQPI